MVKIAHSKFIRLCWGNVHEKCLNYVLMKLKLYEDFLSEYNYEHVLSQTGPIVTIVSI